MARTFHVALEVADLAVAVERYRAILGTAPTKQFPDYAKFELTDPPLILSLNPGTRPGTVTHLGIRYPEPDALTAERERIDLEPGLDVREEPQATCCYAHARKLWVHDADGLPWELYSVTGDAPVHSAPAQPGEAACGCQPSAPRCCGDAA